MRVKGVFTPLRLFALVEVKQFAIKTARFVRQAHDCAELIFGFAGDEIDFLAGFAVVHTGSLGCWRGD